MWFGSYQIWIWNILTHFFNNWRRRVKVQQSCIYFICQKSLVFVSACNLSIAHKWWMEITGSMIKQNIARIATAVQVTLLSLSLSLSLKSLSKVSQKSLKSLSKVSQKSLKSLSKVSQKSLKSPWNQKSVSLNDWQYVTYWAVLDWTAKNVMLNVSKCT